MRGLTLETVVRPDNHPYTTATRCKIYLCRTEKYNHRLTTDYTIRVIIVSQAGVITQSSKLIIIWIWKYFQKMSSIPKLLLSTYPYSSCICEAVGSKIDSFTISLLPSYKYSVVMWQG